MGTAQPTEGLTESYARWRSGRLGEITDALEQQLLFELLGSVAGRQLLDVGCGDGALATELTRRGAIVTGLDADPAMIAAARRRAEIEATQLRLIEGQAEKLPFDDAAFDYVLAVTVLCFVPDAKRAVMEMARVLRPGGRLVIGELGRWSLWAAHRRIRGWLGHPTWRAAMFRTAVELRALVCAAGLDVVEIRGAVHYPPCRLAAQLLASVDLWLGRQTTLGSAFFAVSATKHIEKAGARVARTMPMSETNIPPILSRKHYDASSAFTPESLLRETRRQKGLFPAAVPEICVLDPDGDIVRYLRGAGRADRHPGWACYHTDLYVFRHEKHEYGIVGCAVGAAFAVLIAEELFASGCRFLVSLTSAGQILPVQAPPTSSSSTARFAMKARAITTCRLPITAFPTRGPNIIRAVEGGSLFPRPAVLCSSANPTGVARRVQKCRQSHASSYFLLTVQLRHRPAAARAGTNREALR